LRTRRLYDQKRDHVNINLSLTCMCVDICVSSQLPLFSGQQWSELTNLMFLRGGTLDAGNTLFKAHTRHLFQDPLLTWFVLATKSLRGGTPDAGAAYRLYPRSTSPRTHITTTISISTYPAWVPSLPQFHRMNIIHTTLSMA